MKIDKIEVGDIMELDASEDGVPVVIKFEIIEKSWYPSTVKKGVFFHGVKCRFDNGLEEVLPFLPIEFARKVN